MAFEDPPYRGRRRRLVEPGGKVVEDGLGTGVMAGFRQLSAEPKDLALNLRPGLMGAGMWPPRTWLDCFVATFLEPLDQLVDPPARDAVITSQLGRAAMFENDGVDDVATERGHAPPPSLVARTMSCDIRELCGETRHPRVHTSETDGVR